MTTRYNASLRSTIALAALLALAATATGCGVGLPTQPDIDSGVASERSAGAARSTESGAPQVIEDSDLPSGGGSGSAELPPAGEIIVPTPGTHGNGNGQGWAWGRHKNKVKK